MVDFFLILMITGAGDELQGIKKGILELADAVAINKADGDNAAKAEKTRKELEMALHLMQPSFLTWAAPVMTCSAITRAGLKAIWETVLDHHQRMAASGDLQAKRKSQSLEWMWALIQDGLQERFHRHPEIRRQLDRTIAQVRQGEMGPTTAARELLFLLDNL